MDLGLKGKKVIVQGSSTGLGFAIAKEFSKEGALVCICSREIQRAQDAAKRIGEQAIPFQCDLNDPRAARKLIHEAAQKMDGLDILVTNTGNPKKGYFENIAVDDWRKAFEGLYLSAIESIAEALPILKAQKWGRILLSTSTAAKEPIQGLTISNSLRSGLLGLVKSISFEVAREGITINALLPGYTRTERLQELGISEEALLKEIPAMRLGKPEEYAALAVFLASEKAGYITGQAIACDGGLIKGF